MTCLSSLSELNKRGTLRFFFFFFNLKSFIDLSLRDEIICLAGFALFLIFCYVPYKLTTDLGGSHIVTRADKQTEDDFLME